MGLLESGLIRIPVPVYEKGGDDNHHIYHQFTLRVRERDRLQAYLKENRIGSAIYYPLPLHRQECFAGLGKKMGDFPETEKAASEVLSIPVYPEMTVEQKDYVVQTITDFYRAARG